jgi:hypothetical protein
VIELPVADASLPIARDEAEGWGGLRVWFSAVVDPEEFEKLNAGDQDPPAEAQYREFAGLNCSAHRSHVHTEDRGSLRDRYDG